MPSLPPLSSPLGLAALSFGLLAGCLTSETGDLAQRNDVHGDDEDCCKIEGSAIGEDGVILRVGGDVIVFEAWTPKVGSPGEYVGFRLGASAAGVSYVVKAGTVRHAGSGTTWQHPGGTSGADAPGISYVDFCPDGEPPANGEPPPIL